MQISMIFKIQILNISQIKIFKNNNIYIYIYFQN